MTTRPPRPKPLLTKLLAVALVIVTLLPLLIFAVDLPHWRSVEAARARALARAGVTERPESEEAFRVRRLVRRATIVPSPGSLAEALATQLGVLIVVGTLGRRVFTLRL